MSTGGAKTTGRTRRADGGSVPAVRAGTRVPAERSSDDRTQDRLIDDLRRARHRYLSALERAYRAGLSLQRLRAEGVIGRELE